MASPFPCEYRWGLYGVHSDELECFSTDVLPDSINTLLRYGETYPPALALARNEVHNIDLNERYAKSQFWVSYLYSVMNHLENRNALPFFKAKNNVDERGYRKAGQHLWIVGYHSGLINWVSSDYFVYTDDIAGFSISADDLKRLREYWSHLCPKSKASHLLAFNP